MPFVLGSKEKDFKNRSGLKDLIQYSKKGKTNQKNSLKKVVDCAHPLVLGDGPDGARTR